MALGIEKISPYVGRLLMGVEELFDERKLDTGRMGNLLMNTKSVNLPIEDPVTNGVNAAMPIIRSLSDAQRSSIELVIVGTESGLDFGKPISTYIADYLQLPKRCRSFEVKHACYGGTAALQMALGFINGCPRKNAKALVIAADSSSVAARNTYWEPSQGAGSVAMLVGNNAEALAVDYGANGYYSYEVMDTLRPRANLEAGDSDLSILSYTTCLEESFKHYSELVEDVDIEKMFRYMVLHTPFAGMVKSAHRRVMLKALKGAPIQKIESDFEHRVEPSIRFCQSVGNIYSAALYLALCSLLENQNFDQPERIGLFSYGSGCASEFYSGVVHPGGANNFKRLGISQMLADRWHLSIPDYEQICDKSVERMSGVQDLKPDTSAYAHIYEAKFEGSDLLVLDQIDNFHRKYKWA
ncbi:MAG: hydroxymethylglutaryl-CoA synthase [Pseudomonadota bacterium]